MAKIKRRKLCWTASDSPQVVGYKLYWAQGNEKLSYESLSEKLGNVTEIVLPDEVETFVPQNGPVAFGITAIDELGNESDLMTITAPYQFNAPKAPAEFWIEDAEKSASPAKVQTPESKPSPISLSRHSMTENPSSNPKGIPAPGMDAGRSPDRPQVSAAIRQIENRS